MTNVSLETHLLTKRFGAREALHELSFSARRGDVIGLLGRNGAGKTTTIRLLTTVLAPTSGTFSVCGVPSTDPAGVRQRVGVLPESAGYPPHQTGTDYLRFHARLSGLARADAAQVARRLLAEVGLEDRASSRISTYSRGMRQRLGIARALVNDPAVVLLDEPALGLDPAGQRQVLGIVRDIALRRGATVVLSTHTLSEVDEVCTTVLILDNGKVLVSGSVDEVWRAAAVQRSGRLRVPIELVGKAREALVGVPGLTLDVVEEAPGVLAISCYGAGVHQDQAEMMNAGLRAVLDVNVPVISFDVEGARLSDAFLTLTS